MALLRAQQVPARLQRALVVEEVCVTADVDGHLPPDDPSELLSLE